MVTLGYRGELISVTRGSEAGPSSKHKVSLGLDILIYQWSRIWLYLAMYWDQVEEEKNDNGWMKFTFHLYICFQAS